MKQFRVGDDIAYTTTRRSSSSWAIRFDKVVKVNGLGHIFTESGRKFNKHGDEMVTPDCSYPCCSVIEVDRARAILEAEGKSNETRGAVEALLEALRKKRTGHGNYVLPDEVVIEIEALTEKINPKTEKTDE